MRLLDKLLDFLLSKWYAGKIEWAKSQGYDEGFNNGYRLGQLEKTDYLRGFLPDNNIVKACKEFNTPQYVREINELKGELNES